MFSSLISIYRLTVAILVTLFINRINCYVSDQQGLENYSVFYGICDLSEGKSKEGSLCLSQLSQIAEGIRRRDRWALKLLDASGSPETKLHWGNRFWLGSRSQCYASTKIKNIPVSTSPRTFMETNETIAPFEVDYYGIYFHHNSSMQIAINVEINEFIINMGLCLPSSCKEDGVYSILEEYFNSNKLIIQRLYNMEFKMDSVKRIKEDYSWMREKKFEVFVYFISFMLLLSVIATLYDIRRNKRLNNNEKENCSIQRTDKTNESMQKKLNGVSREGDKLIQKDKTFEKFLLCFSLYKNSVSLFDTNIQGDGEKFKVIFGLRFFLSTWIVMGHVVYYTTDALYNMVSYMVALDKGITKLYSNATFTVDSFLTMSGFLMGYSFTDMEIKRIENNAPKQNTSKKISLFIFGILSRFIRLTPTYMIALGFTEFLTKWRYNETFYWIAERSDVNCPKYWWRNLLYIGNMFPRLELCMAWTWYLNVDMQLFILCFAILILTASNVKAGAYIFTALLFSCNLYVSYIGYLNGYEWYVDNHKKFFDIIYQRPWVRVGPYVIGIFAGYLLRSWNGQLNFSKRSIAFCWILCIATCGILTFGLTHNDTSAINHAIHVGWSRTVWSLATAWLLIACVSDNGGIVSWILTRKIWIPLSRVSYSIYLTHPFIITTFSSFRESAMEVSSTSMIIFGLGYVVICFIFSIIFSLLFESPLIGITKIIIEEGKKTVNKQQNDADTRKKVS